jgi:DNA-binding NarL/FixJ family response regulator
LPDIRVLIADDYPGQNLATRDLSVPEICKVLARTETTDDTLKSAEKLLPDIVLLDSHMPGLLSCVELTRKLSKLRRVKVVVLSESRKLSLIKDFFDAGARAYMLKTDPPALVRMTIFLANRDGKNILSPDLPRSVLKLDDQDA